MRNDEIAAIEGFRDYFLEKGMKVEPWEEGEDPPDFYLTVESERFAVEVTNLIDEIEVNKEDAPRPSYTAAEVTNPIDEIEVNGKDVSRLSYTMVVDKLASEIEKESLKNGIMGGSYVLWVNGPLKDFSKHKRHIKAKALAFLEQMKDSAPGYGEYLLAADETGIILKTDFPDQSPECLHGVGAVFCYIEKKGDSPDRLSQGVTSEQFMDWGAESEQQACKLLRTAISTKCHKLEKVASKRILLLPDLSRFMDLGVYRGCVDGLQGLDNFHSVLISDARGDFVVIHGPW